MISYRKCIGILLLIPSLALYAQEKDAEIVIELTDESASASVNPTDKVTTTDNGEIVIELTGKPEAEDSTEDDIVIWEKDTAQLSKLLQGITREEALYRITSVSSRDAALQAGNGTRYRMLQYGREQDAYRLLFRAKDPQTFIACAVGTEESVKLALEYNIGFGITENEFLATYAESISPVSLPIPDEKTIYRLRRPYQAPQFFLFQNRLLSRPLTQGEVDKMISSQQAIMAQRQRLRPVTQVVEPSHMRTVLIEGGTLHDQLYMPRLVNPEDIPGLPHLTPSTLPAGTPLWSQEIIPQ